MPLFALTPIELAGGQIALAAVLAIAGFALLLPRPRGRFVPGGIAALVAAASVFGAWLHTTYGNPMPDLIGSLLFGLFSLGALGFGTVLVVQRNPARGAIAFAFVILSTCGLFLLLAAPFLMAATIIIYAGAIIVTFLFVLMLSQTGGPSDENDRSREPLFGSLAGFAFVGLVLFTLYLTASPGAKAETESGAAPKAVQVLPAPVLTSEERKTLADVIATLDSIEAPATNTVPRETLRDYAAVSGALWPVVGSKTGQTSAGSIRTRLESVKAGEKVVPLREDRQAKAALERTATVCELNDRAFAAAENHLLEGKPGADAVRAAYGKLRDEVVLLAGAGELPARNVANLGYLLYADHLLAVELAGTLLLVATIGAVAIAHRKGSVQ